MTISRNLAAAILCLAWGAAAAGAWETARPGYAWSFPRDHGSHGAYRTEWWYFTGLLESEDHPGRRFGYQLTFFRIGLLEQAPALDSAWSARQLLMGHAAVSDLAARKHRFSEVLYREIPLLAGFGAPPDARIAWSRAPAGTPGDWTLRFDGQAFDFEMRDDGAKMAFRLSARPLKPLVLQGPGGLSRKGESPGAASLYYSFPRLDTAGTLLLDGRTWKVRGTSWMDREFGSSQLGPGQAGWDWFGLRLAGGRDLMLYCMRRKDGSADFRSATLVSPGGAARYLDPSAWSLRAVSTWKSLGTGAVYPSRWRIEIPSEGIALDVVPRFAAQEDVSRRSAGLHYWEGAVEVEDAGGKEAGEGYVELTGYGEGSRPPL